MPESQIPQHAGPHDDVDDEVFELWAWNEPALQLFRAMKKQWRVVVPVAGRLLYLGLDLAVLPIVEQRIGVACSADTFDALQVMEAQGELILNDD